MVQKLKKINKQHGFIGFPQKYYPILGNPSHKVGQTVFWGIFCKFLSFFLIFFPRRSLLPIIQEVLPGEMNTLVWLYIILFVLPCWRCLMQTKENLRHKFCISVSQLTSLSSPVACLPERPPQAHAGALSPVLSPRAPGWIPWTVPRSGPSLAMGLPKDPAPSNWLCLQGSSPWGWFLVSKSTAHNPNYSSHTAPCLLLADLAHKIYGQQSDWELVHNLSSKTMQYT